MTSAATIRVATTSDMPALARLAEIAGTQLRWEDRLGDGATPTTPLTLVAEHGEDVVGAMCCHPLEVSAESIIWTRHGDAATSPHARPWWKLAMIAVMPGHEGQGIARDLLQRGANNVPRGIDGFYGNVELDRTRAVAWYRRQGFYLAASMGLAGRTGRDGVKVSTVSGEVFFRGELSNVRQHLNGTGHPRSEQRTAAREMKWAVSAMPAPSRDLGYRLYARGVAEKLVASTEGCVHLGLGPRPRNVVGWDPELRVACFDCWDYQLEAARPYDADDLCDGCGQRTTDVQLSYATLEEDLLVVHAGLCPHCRAGHRTGEGS